MQHALCNELYASIQRLAERLNEHEKHDLERLCQIELSLTQAISRLKYLIGLVGVVAVADIDPDSLGTKLVESVISAAHATSLMLF